MDFQLRANRQHPFIRRFIDEDDCVHTSEPSCEPIDHDDEDDEYGHHDSAPSYDTLDSREVVETLFGRTIAREFR